MKFLVGEGVMTRFNRQTQRFTTWLSGATSRDELTALSDRALRDIGVTRFHSNMEAWKPFWMAWTESPATPAAAWLSTPRSIKTPGRCSGVFVR